MDRYDLLTHDLDLDRRLRDLRLQPLLLGLERGDLPRQFLVSDQADLVLICESTQCLRDFSSVLFDVSSFAISWLRLHQLTSSLAPVVG